MPSVFGGGTPFKILHPIISLYPINMVHLFLPFYVGDKSLGNEPVDIIPMALKTYSIVAYWTWSETENSPLSMRRVSLVHHYMVYALNAPHVTDVMVWVSSDLPPLFHHDLSLLRKHLYHVTFGEIPLLLGDCFGCGLP